MNIITRWFALITLMVLLATRPCGAATYPPSVPVVFQDLYGSLNGDLNSFNTNVASGWTNATYSGLSTGTLTSANSNTGPALIGPGYFGGVQLQLQELKALGVGAVEVEVGFPMLYQPFFASDSDYQQYVNFYTQVAASVRAMGLKLIVENNCLLSNDAQDGWNTAAFYSTLTWDQYQQARAQTAQVVMQSMQPDYLVVVQEPDTEAAMSGQSQAGTVDGSTAMLSQILSGIRGLGPTSIQIGAGVGAWSNSSINPSDFITSFVGTSVDFIDIHMYPVNTNDLQVALTIASIAASAGKPVASSETWLWKVRDSELQVLKPDAIRARNPFGFWEPLDTYFLQTVSKLAAQTQMLFLAPSSAQSFFAYLPYDSTSSLTASQIMSMQNQQVTFANLKATYSSVGTGYYSAIVWPADSIPPSPPSTLTAVSSNPATAYLTWSAASDNIGTAGYYLLRNGVKITTTGQTFYQDTGLTGATTYSYAVEAFDAGGNVSPSSLSVSVTTKDVIAPTAPASVTATPVSGQQINLSWSAATDNLSLSTYRVFRGTSPTTLTQIVTVYATTTSFGDYPLTLGTTYYYGVKAVDSSGNVSPMSPTVAATTMSGPAAPADLVAAPLTTTRASLTWSASVSSLPISSYRIYRGISSSSLSQVAVMNTTSYTDNSLTLATTYYYAVQAIDTSGNRSSMSATVSVTTLPGPSAPANLTATALSRIQVKLTWTAAQTGMPLSSYRLYRGTSSSSLAQLIVLSPTMLSYTDYSVAPGTTYYYALQSVDTVGNLSPVSAAVPVTTPQ